MERHIFNEEVRTERNPQKEVSNNPNRGSIRFLKRAVIAAGLAHLFSASAEATGGNCIINVNVAEVPANQPPFTAFFRSPTGQTVHTERNVVVGRNFQFDAPSSDGRTFTVVVATDTTSVVNAETGLCTPTVKRLRFRSPVAAQPSVPPVDSGRPADFWDNLRRFFTEPRLTYGNVVNPGGIFTNPWTYVMAGVAGVGGFLISRGRTGHLVQVANRDRDVLNNRNIELEGINQGLENQVLAEGNRANQAETAQQTAVQAQQTAAANEQTANMARTQAETDAAQARGYAQSLENENVTLQQRLGQVETQNNTLRTMLTPDPQGNVWTVPVREKLHIANQQPDPNNPGQVIIPAVLEPMPPPPPPV
ncbi:MAG: hypothetical protein UT01_C0068G0005 [Candidatus Daviesbacteria bacterium GW2011_GWA1_38_7]|nr:MAG: hypothetical protein UT01_C0068G0005 [Candidatus Daviesbacteria bacterium GW2011_GWA1_38_7]